MCGIAGVLGAFSLSARAEASLGVMLRSMRHRGPDDEGVWESRSGNARFAHARLSILDLSAAGHQPMSSADGRLTITFNGEIYNFRALRSQLEVDGAVFRTNTDTEVILQLYARHGHESVRMLRGMFAFAIWDEHEQSCFLARGPFGIKPLYYVSTPDGLVFASEFRALLESGFSSKRLDPVAVTAYFKTGSVPEPFTLVKGTASLPAGHTLLWKDGRTTVQPFWSIDFPTASDQPPDPVAFTREVLLDSVRHHFVSDVPVGIFLSGGIDSTALVALARADGVRDLHTYSIGLEDVGLDESSLAKKTAAHFNTTHHELQLTADQGRDLFDRFLPCVDQPTIDGFNTYVISWFAHQKGAKVVLSGLGGDEVFGGYSSFQKVPLLWRACRLIKALPGAAGLASHLLGATTMPPRFRRLGALLGGPVRLADVYRAFRGIYLLAEARTLSAHFTGATYDETEYLLGAVHAKNIQDAVCELELTCYMRNQLLKDSDVMSMAHGLELRVPFVDSTLFDTLAKLPAAVRLRKGKRLLLDAVPEIPQWVRDQPKRGFLFPYADWLKSTSWKELFDDSLKDLPVSATAWYQRWSVFVFRHWCDAHGIQK